MTRVILLGAVPQAAINLAALCASQPNFVATSIIVVPDFSTISQNLNFFIGRWLKTQKISFARRNFPLLNLTLSQKIDLNRKFLPKKRNLVSTKRSCYENNNGRRSGRRNGSR